MAFDFAAVRGVQMNLVRVEGQSAVLKEEGWGGDECVSEGWGMGSWMVGYVSIYCFTMGLI